MRVPRHRGSTARPDQPIRSQHEPAVDQSESSRLVAREPGLSAQLIMGGCCSKLNISGPGSSSKGLETECDNVRTGDTPKLSRLQHKESFTNGRVKTGDQALVTSNGGGLGATPCTGADKQR